MTASLPSRALLQLQADWLSDARSRMLRLAEIARRKRVLDLGAGYGVVTTELRRRTSGSVIALDLSKNAVSTVAQPAVCGDATRLPFPVETFDLVFSQNVLLWISKAESVVEEVCRILVSGGVWLLFEPDYGGMIEYPVEASSIWVAALKRAGANPLIGRQLPFFLDKAGFRSRIELLSRILPAAEERFDFLEDLPLTNEERNELAEMRIRSRELSGPRQISHLPYFLIIAERA